MMLIPHYNICILTRFYLEIRICDIYLFSLNYQIFLFSNQVSITVKYIVVPDGRIKTKYQIASLIDKFSIFVPIFKVHYIDKFYNNFYNVKIRYQHIIILLTTTHKCTMIYIFIIII